MFQIQRKFSSHYQRNVFIAVFGFLFLISIINYIISGIGFKTMSGPVNEGLWGGKISFSTLSTVGTILLFFIFFVWINTKSSFIAPSLGLMKEERKEFTKIYGQDQNLPQTNNKKLGVIIIGSLGILYLLQSLPTYLGFELSEQVGRIYYYLIFGLFITGYVGYLKKYFKQAQNIMATFFDTFGKHLSDTQIQMSTEKSNLSSGSSESRPITGRFKGHDFKLDFYTFNPAIIGNYARSRMMGGGGKIAVQALKYENCFELKESTPLHFSLREKNEKWERIEGNTLEEAFQNRFELNGTGASNLPAGFKKLLMDYQRNINLELSENTLYYRAESSDILPYYTAEGVILFLDFMDNLAKELEKSQF